MAMNTRIMGSMAHSKWHERFPKLTGWTGSLILHLLLVMMFGGMTWMSQAGPGSTEIPVSIVISEAAGVTTGGADLPEIETPDTKSSALELEQTEVAEPVTDLGQPTDLAEIPDIASLDLPSDTSETEMSVDWNGFSASGGSAGSGGASFFGLEASGGKFVYVVDRSGSMAGRKLQAAKAEIVRSISSLDREMKFYIIFYDNQCYPMPATNLLSATEINKRDMFLWLEEIVSAGGTDPSEAMTLALSLRPDAVWLLSDGIFSDNAIAVIAEMNPGSKIQINTIAFHSNQGQNVLERIARENKGRYNFVPAQNWP